MSLRPADEASVFMCARYAEQSSGLERSRIARGAGGASRAESYEEPAGTATRTAPARTARVLGNGKRVSVSYCTQEQEEAGFGVGGMSVSKTKGEQ